MTNGNFIEGPGHASGCGSLEPHGIHRHPLPDSYEVCEGHTPRPAPHPGADWRDVQEGCRLNAAQQAARFLTFTQAEQVAFMENRENMVDRAMDCINQNHFGAVYYTKHHRCPTPKHKATSRRQIIRKGRKP